MQNVVKVESVTLKSYSEEIKEGVLFFPIIYFYTIYLV